MPQVLPFLAEAWVAIEGVAATVIPGTSVTIGSVAINTVASIGLSALAGLITVTPKNPAQKQVVRQATAPRRRAYGRVKVGGVYFFLRERTVSGSFFLHQGIMLLSGESDGFEAHWLADTDVYTFMDGAGEVSENIAQNIYRKSGGFGSYALILTALGTTTQAAYAELISVYPEIWTSAHQLKGITNVMVRFLAPGSDQFTTIFPGGLPNYNAVLRASKVWDPRDGTQSASDPSTWKWTRNGVLIVMDYLWHQDGMRLPLEMIQVGIEAWKAQADIADEIVATKDGGTEPRYCLSGAYDLTEARKAVLPRMLDPMDARLGLRPDGAIVIDVGAWQEPTLTISDDQIVSYVGMSRGRQKADVKNEFRAQFVGRDYRFIEQEADPWLNEASIDVDGLQTTQIDLSWSPTHGQTRRRLKIEAARQDPEAWIGQVVTRAYGLKFLTANVNGSRKRTITLQIQELGIDTSFEVQRFAFDPKSGQCTFYVVQMMADAYAWDPATDEGTAPPPLGVLAANGVECPQDLALDSVADGVIAAHVAAPVQLSIVLRLESRPADDTIGDNDATWTAFSLSTATAGTSVVLDDGYYDIRAYFQQTGTDFLKSDPLYIRGIPVSGGAGLLRDESGFEVTDELGQHVHTV